MIKHNTTILLSLVILAFIASNVVGQSNDCKCDWCRCGSFVCNIKAYKYNFIPAYCEGGVNTYVSHISVQLVNTDSSSKIAITSLSYDNYMNGKTSANVISSGDISTCYKNSVFLTDKSINKYATVFECNSGFACTSARYDAIRYCTDKTLVVNNILLKSDKSNVTSGEKIVFTTILRDSNNVTVNTQGSVSLAIESGVSPVGLENVIPYLTIFSTNGVVSFSDVSVKSKQTQTVTLIAKYVQDGKFLESRVLVNVIGDPTYNSASSIGGMWISLCLTFVLTLIIGF